MASHNSKSQTSDAEQPFESGKVFDVKHIEKIKELLQAQKSPTAIRNHSALADADANPLYSVQAVEHICLQLASEAQLPATPSITGLPRPSSLLAQAPTVVSSVSRTASAFKPITPRATVSPGVSQVNLVPHNESDELIDEFADITPPGSRAMSVTSQGGLSSCQTAAFQIWSPDLQGKILVKAQSFDTIMAELSSKSAFKDKGELLLFFCPPSPDGRQAIWVDSAETFDMVLLETQGQWEVRIRPQTPQQARMSLSAPVPDTVVSRQLTYEPSELAALLSGGSKPAVTVAQTQVKYDNAIKTQLKEIVAETLNKSDKKIRFESLPALLLVLDKLDTAWLTYARDCSDFDGVTKTKKLEWFVDACLKVFEPKVAQLWNVNVPKDERVAAAYQSLDSFFIQLIRAVTPANTGLDATTLFGDLATTFDPRSYSSLATVLAEVAEFSQAAKLLDRLSGTSQPVLLEQSELSFWCDLLSDEAHDELVKELAKVAKPVSPFYSTKALAAVKAYRLVDLLTELHKRTSLRADWKPLFKARVPSQGVKSIPPSSKSSARPDRPTTTTSVPDGPRMRQFKYKGIIETVPYHLKDIEGHAEREAACQTFLKHTIFPKAQCSKCHQLGHKVFVCPLFSKLHNDVETNPQSFFLGVRPPAAVRQLSSKPGAAAVMLVTPEPPRPEAAPPAPPADIVAAVTAAFQVALQQSLNGRAGAAP